MYLTPIVQNYHLLQQHMFQSDRLFARSVQCFAIDRDGNGIERNRFARHGRNHFFLGRRRIPVARFIVDFTLQRVLEASDERRAVKKT